MGEDMTSAYEPWKQQQSGEDFDRTQSLAERLTDADRAAGVPGTPAAGYSKRRFDEAKSIVKAAQVR